MGNDLNSKTCFASTKEVLNPSLMDLDQQEILANRSDVKAGLWKFHKYLNFLVTYAIFEWGFESHIGTDII